MASLDPKRYGKWMTTEYASRKNEEAYDHVYVLHHPDEERPACRPLKTAPAYDRQRALGAQFGQVNAWERPNYYGPLDAPDSFDHDSRSFRRGEWWQYAEIEAKAIRKLRHPGRSRRLRSFLEISETPDEGNEEAYYEGLWGLSPAYQGERLTLVAMSELCRGTEEIRQTG